MNQDLTGIIILGLAVNFLTIIGVGWKLSRFFARLELKLEILWEDYQRRQQGGHQLLEGIKLP